MLGIAIGTVVAGPHPVMSALALIVLGVALVTCLRIGLESVGQ
jgi:hypothetical protein